jgi:hypothetical protein
MFAEPRAVMTRVFQFLGLRPMAEINFEPQNVGGYNEKDAATRQWLMDFYAPHTQKLSEISGASFNW